MTSTWTGISVSDPEAGGPRDAAPIDDGDALAQLDRLRDRILACDRELIDTLRRRRDLVQEIGALKVSMGFPVVDPRREAAVVRRAAELARAARLDEELIRKLIWSIMSAARNQQYTPPEEPSE